MSFGGRFNLCRRFGICAAASVAALAMVAPAAAAGPLVASAPDCDDQELSQPFLPWIDPMQYTLAGDGGFERKAARWTLAGGAEVGRGNESYYVTAPSDSRSLRLPAGSSATSPTICVGLEHPTVRLFARETSGVVATMAVEVLFEDASGAVHSLAIGDVVGTESWQPTAAMPIGANLLPLLPGDYTPVAFRFTPVTGDWLIDDLYVDPSRRS